MQSNLAQYKWLDISCVILTHGTRNIKFQTFHKLSLTSQSDIASSPGPFKKSEKRAWYPLFAHALNQCVQLT